ncbi:hypothetical protein [Xanthomonas sp. SI]|uniref:hypothetical protein n=1 Tax=Xanthomonas sp. SI TaxID=2724123 RepID=UPI001639B4EB|nr:hypothetical protein [Xanthomonas sp. SI]
MEIGSIVPARRASPIRVSAAGAAPLAVHRVAAAAGAMTLPARAPGTRSTSGCLAPRRIVGRGCNVIFIACFSVDTKSISC